MPTGVYERKPRKPYKLKPVEDRFLGKVNKDTESGCWSFTGAIERSGYGRFKLNGKMILAHRLSYELHNGPITEGMVVMHSCDNRKCVNPLHLSVGTQLDNVQDMIKKNRDNKAKGSAAGQAKLTENQVIEIKQKLNLGQKQIDIAKEYGVIHQTISFIKNELTWKHVKI